MDKNRAIPPERLEEFYQPYVVQTDTELIKQNCELCQSLPCCPEHCCDVSYDYGFNQCDANQWDTRDVCPKLEAKEEYKQELAKKARPASAYRKNFNIKTWKNEFVPTEDPEFLEKPSGDERIEQNKIKKKILMSKKEMEKL